MTWPKGRSASTQSTSPASSPPVPWPPCRCPYGATRPGRPCPQVLADAGIPVVEDAAQAHGTLVGGRHAGTLGIAGCFSTHDRKLLSTGEGGLILTDDDTLAEKAENYTRLGHPTGRQHGVNYKLAAPLAAIGLRRLPRLEAQITARTANARPVLSELPAGSTLRELPLDQEDKPNCILPRPESQPGCWTPNRRRLD